MRTPRGERTGAEIFTAAILPVETVDAHPPEDRSAVPRKTSELEEGDLVTVALDLPLALRPHAAIGELNPTPTCRRSST